MTWRLKVQGVVLVVLVLVALALALGASWTDANSAPAGFADLSDWL